MENNSWLQSNSFLKRSFAVLGHFIFAYLLVVIGGGIIGLFIGLLFA